MIQRVPQTNKYNLPELRSLHDINVFLKTGKDPAVKEIKRNNTRQKVEQRLLRKVWHKVRHLEYNTEVSVLNRCRDRLPRNVCPHCQRLFYSIDLIEESSIDYTYRCYQCGTVLSIIKD